MHKQINLENKNLLKNILMYQTESTTPQKEELNTRRTYQTKVNRVTIIIYKVIFAGF